jgi:hypothetical protein
LHVCISPTNISNMIKYNAAKCPIQYIIEAARLTKYTKQLFFVK